MTRNRVYYFFKFTENASRCSDLLLQEALKAFWNKTGLEAEDVIRTPEGKPCFPSGRVHLSVTHTGPLYAAVFSPRPIGIDGERREEEREGVARRYFTPEERNLPFSYVWCGKEAVAKLVGDGLKLVGKIRVSQNYAEYGGRRYRLREEILGDFRLVTATEEGWDYGAETLSEK